jgi:hypothetical protein
MGGPSVCVGGGPPKMITCGAWCDKYKHGSTQCKYTHPQGCMKKYGSLKAPVRDRPPQ